MSKFWVERLDVFGSAARGDFQPGRSDFDFIVSFADRSLGSYADRYLDFAMALEELLQSKVDLLTERSIRNPFFRQKVEAARRPVYVRRSPKTVA